MGSGLSTLTWLDAKVDEDTVRELARDMGTIPFDDEAFGLLADRNKEVRSADAPLTYQNAKGT